MIGASFISFPLFYFFAPFCLTITVLIFVASSIKIEPLVYINSLRNCNILSSGCICLCFTMGNLTSNVILFRIIVQQVLILILILMLMHRVFILQSSNLIGLFRFCYPFVTVMLCQSTTIWSIRELRFL